MGYVNDNDESLPELRALHRVYSPRCGNRRGQTGQRQGRQRRRQAGTLRETEGRRQAWEKGKPDKGDKGKKDAGKERKDFDKADKGDKDNTEWRKKSFRKDDRKGVLRYFSGFRENERGLPPGLAKNYLRGKSLPPGWQKKVYGGYVIGDDLRGYFHPLEYSLFPGLEAVPDTRLYLYGNRIVRVYEPRREVIDIIEVPTIRFD